MRADETHDADLRDGEKMDHAVRLAFADAIRRHRQANVPMAIWEDEQVKLVSPFDLPLPEEVSAPEVPRRRAQAGD
jgi:hypothetical protein